MTEFTGRVVQFYRADGLLQPEYTLTGVNKEIRNTQSQLTDINRLLKPDPTNSELLLQKQKLLSQAVGETKEKLTQFKSVQDQMDVGLKNVSVTQEQYDARTFAENLYHRLPYKETNQEHWHRAAILC